MTIRRDYLEQNIQDSRVQLDQKGKSKSTLENFGIAFDLGTTTIVGYLVDLNSGKILATDSLYNPQIVIGEDVISRLAYAEKSDIHQIKIQQLVLTAFNFIISHLLAKSGISTTSFSRISEIVVVGNTVMHHLFFKFPIKNASIIK